MKFTTTIFLDGNNTGIEVPPEVVEQLGGGKRQAVHVTVAGFSYRSTVSSMGGKFLIPLSAARRAEAGVKGGDAVEVELSLDTVPRVVDMPADFATRLEAEPKAKAFFETLSYSNQLRHVLSITDAKTDETRQKRIAKAIETLLAGKK
jgi:antitoxin component of MazEF toxin-antitoxin module